MDYMKEWGKKNFVNGIIEGAKHVKEIDNSWPFRVLELDKTNRNGLFGHEPHTLRGKGLYFAGSMLGLIRDLHLSGNEAQDMLMEVAQWPKDRVEENLKLWKDKWREKIIVAFPELAK